MQLHIFGLLVCLANLCLWFPTCGFSSFLENAVILNGLFLIAVGLIAWLHKGVCWLLLFSGHVEKNGCLCTDVSRRGKNFDACFPLIGMDVSRFTTTFLELLPSWEEFPFQTISVGDLYKDAALAIFLVLGTLFEMYGVTGKLYFEPRVLPLFSGKCLTVAYVVVFILGSEMKKSFRREVC